MMFLIKMMENRMNQENQKIWQFVLNNQDILKHLFHYDLKTQNLDEYMLTSKYYQNMTPYEINTVKNNDWLYRTTQASYKLIGVDKENDIIHIITNTGEVGIFCETFDSIPYEILRRDMLEDETTYDYLRDAPQFHQALLKYEAWAKENGIQLDKYNIYHNDNGELFKEFFEW